MVLECRNSLSNNILKRIYWISIMSDVCDLLIGRVILKPSFTKTIFYRNWYSSVWRSTQRSVPGVAMEMAGTVPAVEMALGGWRHFSGCAAVSTLAAMAAAA